MTITEKVAFLKGLVEGSELNLGKKEEKIFNLFIELLDDMANAVSELDEDVSALYDDVEDISEAVDEIDDMLCNLSDEDGFHDESGNDFLYEIQCEKCGEKLSVDEDTLLGDDIVCPSCGEPIEFEFDCDCDDCDDKETH